MGWQLKKWGGRFVKMVKMGGVKIVKERGDWGRGGELAVVGLWERGREEKNVLVCRIRSTDRIE